MPELHIMSNVLKDLLHHSKTIIIVSMTLTIEINKKKKTKIYISITEMVKRFDGQLIKTGQKCVYAHSLFQLSCELHEI
jgi:hypothetical protein